MDRTAPRRASLIGAPTDVGAGVPGACDGPRALRAEGLIKALGRLGVAVNDRGDVDGPENPQAPPVGGYRNADEVGAWCAALKAEVSESLGDGEIPIVLGGDHCLSIGSVAAVASHCRQKGKPLRVVWLDAHADFNTAESSPSGNVHGMPLAALTFDGPPQTRSVVGESFLMPGELRLVGIRSVDPEELDILRRLGVSVVGMDAVAKLGMRAAMEGVLADLPADAHVHVSFDVDFLDPRFAPGVGTRVDAGPDLEDARVCMRMLAETGRVGSVDVMELNPSLDVESKTARAAVDLLGFLFGAEPW